MARTDKHKAKRISTKKLLTQRILLIAGAAVLLTVLILGIVELSMRSRDYYVVGAKLLNVRDAPSGEAGIEGQLYLGEHVRITADHGNGFVSITTAHGLSGWCAQSYLRRDGLITRAFINAQAPKRKSLYYTPADLENDLTRLQEDYSDYVTVSAIGQSAWGNTIYMLAVGNTKAQNCLMVQGAIHAREYATAKLTVDMAENFLSSVTREQLLNHCVIFIPMLNPDGALLCQEGIKAAPKELRDGLIAMNGGFSDFSRWKANGRGVDLNANFDARWAPNEEFLSPGSQGYRGEMPFSEPETVAIRDITAQMDVDSMACYHSFGQIIYWYFGQQDAALERDRSMADALAGLTGYQSVAPQEPITSVAGSKDWFVQAYGKPGFTIEIFDSGAMPPTREMYIQELPRHLGVVAYLLAQME